MTLEKLLEGFAVLEVLQFRSYPDLSIPLNQKIWMNALDNLTDEDFMKAINIISKTPGLKFFPSSGEIIEAANKGKILSASEAFLMVEKEIERCCGTPDINPGEMTPVIWNVVKNMGGLMVIWERTDRSFVRKEFMKAYNQIVSSDKMIKGGDVKELEDKDARS